MMSEMSGSNFPININPLKGGKGKAAKDAKDANLKLTQNTKEQLTNQTNQNINQLNQNTLNSNTNIQANPRLQTNPTLNQNVLNNSNLTETNVREQNIKKNIKIQTQATPSQADFQGPHDLPAYSGISNMSLKSWISNQGNKTFTKLESNEKTLNETLGAIKGFQKQNYEGFEDEGSLPQSLGDKIKKLLLLSHVFSRLGESSASETELIVNINTFKKLGCSLKNKSFTQQEEDLSQLKLSPPIPEEIQKPENINTEKIKCIHQLFALPNEFPECLRLFSKENLELNPKELSSFLNQRVKLVKELIVNGDNFLKEQVANFIPLLNQNDFPVMLPLAMLYYPLPLPQIKDLYDFLDEWEKKKKETDLQENIISSCEIYYLSKTRGRFLLKFELNDKNELSFNVQTAKINNGIVRDLEQAVSESMVLLESPPELSDLNVMLTKEIYKATDIDEEISMVSKGSIRLEIVLAVYAALVILNKLNEEPDPSGVIDILE